MGRRRVSVGRAAWGLALAMLGAGTGMLGYSLLRTQIAAEVYRAKLSELTEEYGRLTRDYNEAVRKTAVTELVVREGPRGAPGTLSVRVRTAAGVHREIETPFDPAGEVYVDFVVADGRLWIRRVFDAQTPPGKGLVIDPEFADVEWSRETVGKAVYRRLSPGRWVVTVTGGGSLGLARVGDADGPVELAAAPPVKDFDRIEEEAKQTASAVGMGEVWRKLVGW